MPFAINPAVLAPAVAQPASAIPQKTGADFQSFLKNAIQGVEQTRANATDSVNRFLSGENEEVHQTVLATQQAELSFELFLQVRNKVVQAYQEVMRMQM
jgi:flagellar hook-basal body complex protein FliE